MEKSKKKLIFTAILFSVFFFLNGNWENELVEYHPQPVLINAADDAYYPSIIFDPLHFGENTGDPVGTTTETYVYAPFYKMWFSMGSGIGFAYSADGINWTVCSSGSITGLLNPHHVSVIYTGGYYYIWYWNTSVIYAHESIRYAESSDGISWTNDQPTTGNLITGVSPDWNRGSYGPCQVFYNDSPSNSGTNPFEYTFFMYFDGTTGGVEETGLGYSIDGLNWELYGRVLAHGNPGDWDSSYASRSTIVRISDDQWHMWYSGGQTRLHEGIGHAESADGVNWIKNPNNPIWHINDGVAYRNSRTYTPWILYREDRFAGTGDNIRFKGWLSARSGSDVRTIGYLGTNQLADLSLIKSVDNHSPAKGDTISYTIAIRNNGPVDASGVIVRDILPSGIIFNGYTSTSGSYSETNGIWNPGSIQNGTSEFLYITARVASSGTILNTAEITASNQPDPDSVPDNNERSEDDQDSVQIVTNALPVAVITGNSSICPVPSIIALSATDSFDIDGHITEYRWELISRPEGSDSMCSDCSSERIFLTADLPGQYCFSLTVKDNSGLWSRPAQQTVNAELGISPEIRISGKRFTERSWILKKDYFNINLKLIKSSQCLMRIRKFQVFRSSNGSSETLILEITPDEFIQSADTSNYIFTDKFHDADRIYTFRFTAINYFDAIAAESSITLNPL